MDGLMGLETTGKDAIADLKIVKELELEMEL
jgi:hypothetical protein